MKSFIGALSIFIIIVILATFHTYHTLSVTSEIQALSSATIESYKNDDWDAVSADLEDIKKIWKKNHLWAHMTLSTKQIDEIELSLSQSQAYADISEGTDFYGEFVMFCMLIEHLPKQEAFSIGELL